MSILFDDGSSEYLLRSEAVVSGAPFTMAAWAKPDANDDEQVIMWIGDIDNRDRFQLYFEDSPLVLKGTCEESGDYDTATTSNNWSVGAWHHTCVTYASNRDITVTLNGDTANQGTNSPSANPTNLDNTAIGVLPYDGSAKIRYFSGLIALPCIWSTDLSPDEVAALAAGAHPLMIRPDDIVAFWPLNTL